MKRTWNHKRMTFHLHWFW